MSEPADKLVETIEAALGPDCGSFAKDMARAIARALTEAGLVAEIPKPSQPTDDLKSSLSMMATHCSVDMETWDRHANLVLSAIATIEAAETPKAWTEEDVEPEAWLIRELRGPNRDRASVMAGQMFKSFETANAAAVRLTNLWRLCIPFPVVSAPSVAEARARFELLKHQDEEIDGKDIALIRSECSLTMAKAVVNLKGAAQWAVEYGNRLADAIDALSTLTTPKATPDVLTALRKGNEERQIAWANGEDVPLLFRATELGGEVGEVLNACKKLERERRGWIGSRATVEDVASELGDVVICADLLAMTLGIDLGKAVIDKFNATSIKVGLPHRLAPIQED